MIPIGSSQNPSPSGASVEGALAGRRAHRVREVLIHRGLWACALLSVLVTAGIIIVLLTQSLPFFQNVSVWEFLTDTKWVPLADDEYRRFGILPLVCGTLMIAVGACVVALPIGVGSALFLSEYAPTWLRNIVKPILEILAGIPTIVYGYFALTVVTPFLGEYVFDGIKVFNAASASIVVGIMIIPMISSLCEDAFSMVPNSLRQGAYALGARRMSVALRVVFPAALSGVVSSFILAVSRAIGETMAVSLAAGSLPNLDLDILGPVQTMTAYIVQIALGDVPHGTLEYHTLFAVGLVLFVMTWLMNLVAHKISGRFAERYV